MRRGGYIQLVSMFCAATAVLLTDYYVFFNLLQEKVDPYGTMGLSLTDARVITAFLSGLISAKGASIFLSVLLSAGISIAIAQPRIGDVR